MRFGISQLSSLSPMLKCFFLIPSVVVCLAHFPHCKWILRFNSFRQILLGFFTRFDCGLATERTFVLQTLFYFTCNIGMRTALADQFAAAKLHNSFLLIIQQWQTADRTFSIVCNIRLLEQFIVTYFCQFLFAGLFVLR